MKRANNTELGIFPVFLILLILSVVVVYATTYLGIN